MFKKIHIVGGPGSGKTTLSLTLSKEFGLPVFDLDNFYWKSDDYSFKEKEDLIVRDNNLKKVLSKKKWITEGVYFNWAWHCFEKAEVIIFLEPGFLVSSFRIIKRFFMCKLGFEKRKKKELWINLFRLLVWNKIYTFKHIPLLKEKIKSLNKKVIYVKTSKTDVVSLLK
ncbi:hypothetical protein KO361_03255 [Candidatus Woesearchaeota archaeon]|jgi:adenylate kinase family enzyme|nr:hypothetical protein [Candidatus Woesearchaeota archaeon]